MKAAGLTGTLKRLSHHLWRLFSCGCRAGAGWAGRLFHIEITDARWHVIEQFLKFSLVGCSNAGVTLLIYYLVLWVNPAWYLAGNTAGYIAGILNSFFWNSRLVFRRDGPVQMRAFWRMLLCYLLTYILQTGLLFLFVEHCRISDRLAPVLTILIATPINFALNKLWAFRENGEKKDA